MKPVANNIQFGKHFKKNHKKDERQYEFELWSVFPQDETRQQSFINFNGFLSKKYLCSKKKERTCLEMLNDISKKVFKK